MTTMTEIRRTAKNTISQVGEVLAFATYAAEPLAKAARQQPKTSERASL